MNNSTLKTLYDSDFQHWLEQTISYLENQQFNQLDIQNLVEELKELGRSDRKALESNLMILIAHLLKLRIQNTAVTASEWHSKSLIEWELQPFFVCQVDPESAVMCPNT
jgi:hypothetical protein